MPVYGEQSRSPPISPLYCNGVTLTPGTRLGVFELADLLGRGGMGEVYRATDTKLKRQVAIKVLPPAVAADRDRFARFQREAEVLASLNHPNIAAIYGLEESDGITALVMELVEGDDLSQRIARGAIPLDEALPIAKQIAEALEAAHEQGIIHRDLKPANIKVRSDGTVKVLDFGLAKAMAPASSSDAAAVLSNGPTITSPAAMTAAGVVLGTAAYMSPEQARGCPLDKRADIWSFGCVLYEILAGRRAFPGETMSDTIAAVLDREPDWTALPAGTPAAVRHLLSRCLMKDARQRLRDIGDARAEFDPTGLAAVHAPADVTGGAWWRSLWAIISFTAAVAAIATAAALRRSEPGPLALDVPAIERLTFDPGVSESPSLSADGRLLAYASTRSGRPDSDIWVRQMAGGTPLRVTEDPAEDTDPDLSADGSRVVFRSERSGGGAYLVSALGGPARLIAPDARNPKLSPDGMTVAYWTGQFRGQSTGTRSATFVLSIAVGTPRRVLPDFRIARDPVWAPDGRSLLVLAMRGDPTSDSNPIDWWRVPLDGGSPTRTTVLDRAGWRTSLDQNQMTAGPWLPSGFLLAMEGNLWALPVSPSTGSPEGPPRPLMFGAGAVFRPTSSRDGVVVFGQPTTERVVERAPLTTADTPAPVLRLFADGRPGIGRASETRDGQTIVFERASASGWEIWRKDLRTGDQQIVLSVSSKQGTNPTVSPDGSRIGYTVSDAEGLSVTINGTGYVVDVAGGVPKKVCDECGVYAFLSDSRRVVATFSDTAIRVVDVVGGAIADLARDADARIERPSVSPDDRWLAYRRTTGTAAKVFVVPASGGAPASAAAQVDEPTTTGRPAGWSPDSRILYLLLDTDRARCLWAQPVDSATGRLVGKPYVVRHFHELSVSGGFGTSLGNAVTAQGFLYEANSVRSNLWRLTPASPK